MTHQNNTEESLQAFFEREQTPEDYSPMFSKLFDSEDTTDMPVRHLPDSPNSPGSSVETISTSEIVELSNQDIPFELSDSRVEVADTAAILSQELLGSTSGQSDAETRSRLTFNSSPVFSFLESDSDLGEFSYRMERARQKGYLLPFELICLIFAVACCFMGAYYWPSCPADEYIPRYVFFNGALATFSVSVAAMNSLWKFFLRFHNEAMKYCCAFGLGWAVIVTTLIEMTQFYTMSYNFQPKAENYCDETFYWFVYYKNIAFGVVMFLTGIIYLPTFNEWFRSEFFMSFIRPNAF